MSRFFMMRLIVPPVCCRVHVRAHMGRSGPQPCPAAPAHAACQSGQAAQSCARSGMVEPAGSMGRSA
eukprot:7329080-Prymnesium_polylepis.1